MRLSTATVEVVWAVVGADIVLQNDNGDDILEMTIMATVGFFGGIVGLVVVAMVAVVGKSALRVLKLLDN